MKRLGRWIKRKFKIEFKYQLDWHSFSFGGGWTWNNNQSYFSTGPMLGFAFWVFGLEIVYKKGN